MESTEISLVDLPVGFRFRPTEEELVNHYLKLKILGNKKVERIIPEVDVHQLPPWDLPSKINELSSINSDDDEWFFFCRLQNKYPQSKRTRRSNDYGSWKPTGETREIRTQDKKNILGLKKILVFKKRQSPKNAQTNWVLHEYRLNADVMDNILTDQESLEENVQQPPPPILSPECNSSECDFSATAQPPTETREQLTRDSSYWDLESYIADNEQLEEILGMLNS